MTGAAIDKLIDEAAEWTPLDLELGRLRRSDLGNAWRLVKRHGDDLAHVPEIGWLSWIGSRWSIEDGPVEAQRRAHQTVRAIAAEAGALDEAGKLDGETDKQFDDRIDGHRKWCTQSGNSNRIAGLLREAQPYVTRRVEHFDANPLLLTVENATLDLKGGKVDQGRHKRRHLITRLAPVRFDADASCPTFTAFLAKIQPDATLRGFLQRWFGYCLTGHIHEQCLVLFHGRGSNGKSTLLNAVRAVLGTYATSLPFASLLHDDRRRGSEATPDLAQLPGARLVIAAEAEESARFDEALLKALTGGEPIKVRHLGKDFFEFVPAFKLTLSFNARPQVRGSDEGIWRRLCLVPFDVTIPKHEADPTLLGRLRAEAPGILNWMLEGYRDWAAGGLAIPDAVRAATASYRSDSDPVGEFLAARTRPAKGINLRAKALYDAYTDWCQQNSIEPLSGNAFGRRVTERGIVREKVGTMFYRDIKLYLPPEDMAAKPAQSDWGPGW